MYWIDYILIAVALFAAVLSAEIKETHSAIVYPTAIRLRVFRYAIERPQNTERRGHESYEKNQGTLHSGITDRTP
jgi:hypothetical protein